MAQLFATLVRHADFEQPIGVPSAHLPHPLTATGRGQACQLAKSLIELEREGGLRVHAQIHCSSLLRAWETGCLAVEALEAHRSRKFELIETVDLAERSLGSMANLTVEEIEDIVARDPRYEALPPGWKATAETRLPFPGCESLAEAGERVARYIRATLKAVEREVLDDTAIVFIGHGAALRHAAAKLGVFDFEGARAVSMHYARPVTLEARDAAPWKRVYGEWKPRGAGVPRD